MCKDRFRNFIVQQESSDLCLGLKLPALLITPIQRIPRYQLLLEQLLRYSENDEDVKRLRGGLEAHSK